MSSTYSSPPPGGSSAPGGSSNKAHNEGKGPSGTPNIEKGRHRGGGFRKVPPRQPKFEGKCEDLKGHIYDCSDSKQADIYTRTTKEVAEYVGKTYKYGNDVRLAIESLSPPAIQEPNDPPQGASRTQERMHMGERG